MSSVRAWGRHSGSGAEQAPPSQGTAHSEDSLLVSCLAAPSNPHGISISISIVRISDSRKLGSEASYSRGDHGAQQTSARDDLSVPPSRLRSLRAGLTGQN